MTTTAEAGTLAPDMLSAWDLRLIAVITDCEDDVRRYGRLIEAANGPVAGNGEILARCMANPCAHRHLTLLTALHLVRQRFDCAEQSIANAHVVPPDGRNENLKCETARLDEHICLLDAMMHALYRRLAQEIANASHNWRYADTTLAQLIERRLYLACDDAMQALQQQFSCSLAVTLMAAVEPAMKDAQDKLTLRPELPLNVKAFAGSMLALKIEGQPPHRTGTALCLNDMAADISHIFKIPGTLCLSA